MFKAIFSLKDNSISGKLRLAGILLIPAVLYAIDPNWLNNQHSLCLFKNITGHECYGCGMTRAIVSAMHLKFREAWNFNRLVVIVFPLLIWVWIRIVVSLICNNWIYRKRNRIIKSFKP
jgi:hypothetical protein